jgi:hypothetical protein
MSMTGRARAAAGAGALLVALAAPALAQEQAAPSSVSVPLGLALGFPQGEFAEGVSLAIGMNGGLIWNFGGWMGLRTEFSVQSYGSATRRVPLGGGALGLVNVDVTTTHSILGGGLGLQVGMPGSRPTPYLGGTLGFSAFTTISSVTGSNSSAEPFASSTNESDAVFAKVALAGLYIPVGGGKALIDVGVRQTWNGEKVRYLTEGDITEDAGGNIVLTPRETRADLLTVTLGVTLRIGARRR